MLSDLARKFQTWKAPSSLTGRVVVDYLAALDSPVALSIYILYVNGEFDQIVKREINPHHYNDADSFRRDFLAISFLRKSKFLKTSINRREVATAAFKAAEARCKESNQRIKTGHTAEFSPQCEWIISDSIRKIERILGAFDIDVVLNRCAWGPGVTQTVKGCDTSSATKFLVDRDITKDAQFLFEDVLSAAFPLWGTGEKTPSIGNRVLFVPKNAKTDRSIAVEPGLNSWIQLGIGRTLRMRLRRAGYNLNSDLKNKRQAYLGSIDGSMATVDFSAASDTISIECVRLLLPPRWFTVLDAARSKFYQLDGIWSRAEKFSTMGCGFTFELESLIFLAVALATCDCLGLDTSGVSIFGDDVTLPSEAVEEFGRCCSYLGFCVNTEKSFSTSYFRESCGDYYFNGICVKPYFLKERIRNVRSVFKVHNGLLQAYLGDAFCVLPDNRLRRCLDRLRLSLPSRLRLYGGVNETDGAFVDIYGEGTYLPLKHGHEGFSFMHLVSVPLVVEKEHVGLLLSRLHSGSQDIARNNNVELRSRTRTVLARGWCRRPCERLGWETA